MKIKSSQLSAMIAKAGKQKVALVAINDYINLYAGEDGVGFSIIRNGIYIDGEIDGEYEDDENYIVPINDLKQAIGLASEFITVTDDLISFEDGSLRTEMLKDIDFPVAPEVTGEQVTADELFIHPEVLAKADKLHPVKDSKFYGVRFNDGDADVCSHISAVRGDTSLGFTATLSPELVKLVNNYMKGEAVTYTISDTHVFFYTEAVSITGELAEIELPSVDPLLNQEAVDIPTSLLPTIHQAVRMHEVIEVNLKDRTVFSAGLELSIKDIDVDIESTISLPSHMHSELPATADRLRLGKTLIAYMEGATKVVVCKVVG